MISRPWEILCGLQGISESYDSRSPVNPSIMCKKSTVPTIAMVGQLAVIIHTCYCLFGSSVIVQQSLRDPKDRAPGLCCVILWLPYKS